MRQSSFEVRFGKDECIKGQWAEPAQMERYICSNIYLQSSLMQEIIALKDALEQNPELREEGFGMNCRFIIGERSDPQYFLETLRGIYGNIFPLVNPEDGSVAGYQTSTTFSQARGAIRKLHEQNRLDKFVEYFMSPDKKGMAAAENASVLVKKGCACPEKVAELEQSDFYGEIANFRKHEGQAVFIAGGFSMEELAADPYIKALAELEDEVQICACRGEGYLSVIVR